MASESFAKYCEFMHFSKGQGQFILSDYLDLFKKKKPKIGAFGRSSGRKGGAPSQWLLTEPHVPGTTWKN